jgi:hypothetical protein
MIIGAYNQGPWTLIALVITTILLNLGFWLWNAFSFAPYYATRMHKSYETSTDEGTVVIEREERTYPQKVAADLKCHNDQNHFQSSFWRSIFILLFLAIFLGQNGVHTFQPLPVAPTAAQTTNFVISKLFQLMVLGSAAWSFNLLMETHSDFMWRHMTAANDQRRDEGKEDTRLGSNVNQNQRRKDVSVLIQ